jgi:hypothetical protein
MAQRQVRYYFGRLNVIAQRPDKSRLLTDGIRPHKIISHRNLNWGFFKTSILSSAFGTFVHGFLVKFKPTTEEEVAIPETHEIDDRTVENKITAKARFFLHVPSHIIAYHPFGREISRSVFANRFKELFQSNLDDFFVEAEILPIDEERKVREAIRSLRKISRIKVYLHPSNPTNREVWRGIDERLRAIEASSYREEYEAEPSTEGLKILKDKEINSKIAMAEDGYGTVYVTGEVEGERRTVSTRDAPLVALAPTDDQSPEVVLERLAIAVKRIIERFTE